MPEQGRIWVTGLSQTQATIHAYKSKIAKPPPNKLLSYCRWFVKPLALTDLVYWSGTLMCSARATAAVHVRKLSDRLDVVVRAAQTRPACAEPGAEGERDW